MARSSPRWRLVALLLGAVSGVSACGGGSSDDGACGPITRESLDPAFLVHIVGDAQGVEYTSDPPTSGPHQPAPSLGGPVNDPLTRPVQVGVLERGDVLLQYDPDLPAGSVALLQGLAEENAQVAVAPNPDLPEPMVATAWLFKRSCQSVDVAALQEFVDERVGQGPEG